MRSRWGFRYYITVCFGKSDQIRRRQHRCTAPHRTARNRRQHRRACASTGAWIGLSAPGRFRRALPRRPAAQARSANPQPSRSHAQPHSANSPTPRHATQPLMVCACHRAFALDGRREVKSEGGADSYRRYREQFLELGEEFLESAKGAQQRRRLLEVRELRDLRLQPGSLRVRTFKLDCVD